MISDDLRDQEVACDAPPYCVVRRCQDVGFRRPLDVRWLRMRQVRPEPQGWRRWFSLALWKRYLGRRNRTGLTCACGTSLPGLKRFRYVDGAGTATDYLLAQCGRCRTMIWNTF
jgi:hypothetical protein